MFTTAYNPNNIQFVHSPIARTNGVCDWKKLEVVCRDGKRVLVRHGNQLFRTDLTGAIPSVDKDSAWLSETAHLDTDDRRLGLVEYSFTATIPCIGVEKISMTANSRAEAHLKISRAAKAAGINKIVLDLEDEKPCFE